MIPPYEGKECTENIFTHLTDTLNIHILQFLDIKEINPTKWTNMK